MIDLKTFLVFSILGGIIAGLISGVLMWLLYLFHQVTKRT